MNAPPRTSAFAILFAPAFSISTFFVFVGWVTTHYVDRYIDTPTIEYDVSSERLNNDAPPLWEVRANVTNISQKNTFRNAKFLFVGRFDGKGVPLDTVFDVNEEHTEMIFRGPTLPEGKRRAKVQVPGAEFVVPVFPPGASVELVTRYFGKDKPRFVGAPSIDGDDSFVLVERSLATFVVARYLYVMLGIIVVWLLVILFVAYRNHVTISQTIHNTAGHSDGVGAANRG